MKRSAIIFMTLLLAVTIGYAQDATPPEFTDAVAFDGNHLDLFFSEQLDSATAVQISNYSVIAAYAEYDIRSLTIDSVSIDESNISVRLRTVEPLSSFNMFFRIEVSSLKDTSDNVMAETETRDVSGIPPVGYANWNHEDGYVIEGTVKLIDGTPVTNYLVPIHNDGPDGVPYFQNSPDDVDLRILADETGYFRVEGLPSEAGVSLSDDGHYNLSVWSHDIYEPYGWGFSVSDSVDGVYRNFVIYPVVEGTSLEGTILDGDGNVIPFPGYSGDDIAQIGRGDVSVWSHPPSYTDSTANMYYNPLTGEYKAKGNLGGGTYDVAFFLPGTNSVNQSVNIPAGQTATLNVTLTPGEVPTLLPITMGAWNPDTLLSETDQVTLTWEPVEDESIVCYLVGIWSSNDVLITAGTDSAWSRSTPNVAHVALPDTCSSITLSGFNGSSVSVEAPADYHLMSSAGTNQGDRYYWGVFASSVAFDEINPGTLDDYFVGAPAAGLQQFLYPVCDSPLLNWEYADDIPLTLTATVEFPEDGEIYVRVFNDDYSPDKPFELYTAPIEVESPGAQVWAEAFVDLIDWVESDTVSLYAVTDALPEQRTALPKSYSLLPAFPNPFNPSTTVSVTLPEAARLTVVVYDILGREVASLTHGSIYQPGIARFSFEGRGLASGIYFVRAVVNGKLDAVQKVVLLR